MNKILALWALFQKGNAVANPALWRAGQITGNMLGALILAIVQTAKVFGYELPVDTATAYAVGGGIISIANAIVPIITSKHTGLPMAAEPTGDGVPTPDNPEVQPEAPAVQHVAVASVEPSASDIAKYLAEAHAALNKDRGRTEDSSYYGN